MNLLVGISVASLIGTNIVMRTANTIVQQGIDVLSFARSGSYSATNINDAQKRIEEMDIKIKMKVMKKLLNVYSATDEDPSALYYDRPRPLRVSVQADICEDMDKMVARCEALILDIETLIAGHETKWFKRYRTFDVSGALLELERYNTIMKNRIELIILENDM